MSEHEGDRKFVTFAILIVDDLVAERVATLDIVVVDENDGIIKGQPAGSCPELA